MSLINDALKNAHRKADQARQSAVEGLALRPAEPAQPPRRNAWLVPAIAVVVLALIAVVAVNIRPVHNSSGSASYAETLAVNARVAIPAVEPSPTAAQDVSPAGKGAITPATPSVPERSLASAVAVGPEPVRVKDAPVAVPTTSGAGAATQSPAETTAPTDANAPAAVALPQPEPLRLQAIVYHPTRPSATISGKTVFLGERVHGMKVVSITRDTATINGNGKNLVLTLPD